MISSYVLQSHRESPKSFESVVMIHNQVLDKSLRHHVIFDNKNLVPFLNQRFELHVVEQVLGDYESKYFRQYFIIQGRQILTNFLL